MTSTNGKEQFLKKFETIAGVKRNKKIVIWKNKFSLISIIFNDKFCSHKSSITKRVVNYWTRGERGKRGVLEGVRGGRKEQGVLVSAGKEEKGAGRPRRYRCLSQRCGITYHWGPSSHISPPPSRHRHRVHRKMYCRLLLFPFFFLFAPKIIVLVPTLSIFT